MQQLKPIYTVTAKCQDCYKCLRQCPVKAVEIRKGSASVIHSMCISCGHCVNVCPIKAKKYRDDIPVLSALLSENKKNGVRVIASLAPSFITEFSNITENSVINALKMIGFDGVSETALGAQEVSANIAAALEKDSSTIKISSACPVVVEYINKYYPEFSANITGFLSPVLAHCKMLKEKYGQDTSVVFIGPCIAKKLESDASEHLDLTLTFDELRRYLFANSINLEHLDNDKESFIPQRANEGNLYPVDGGMIAGIKANCTVSDERFMTFSGLKNIKSVLEELSANAEAYNGTFLELLACEGGCVNGPMMKDKGASVGKRVKVLKHGKSDCSNVPRKPTIDIENRFEISPVYLPRHRESEIRTALQLVGKYRPEDELNCGACGYNSCRDFASAMLEERAEPGMCLGNMRRLAHKKLDALIKTLPCGILIADNNMRIIEANRKFAEYMGPDNLMVFNSFGELTGASLEKVVPFHNLFTQVLEHNNDFIEKELTVADNVLNINIFSIEPNTLIGCIAQDITEPAVQKEQIIKKSQEVMEQNLGTVQKIAHLLGENAAASEAILNSIVNTFTKTNRDNSGKSNEH